MFVPRPRPVREYELVKALLAKGLADREIARRTGIPYHTVRGWRKRSTPPGPNGRPPIPGPPPGWRPPDPIAYCYLLGLYLGDGSIWVGAKASPRLMLTLDARYPGIIAEAVTGIRATFPGISVCENPVPGAVAVCASASGWLGHFLSTDRAASTRDESNFSGGNAN
jgi:hypothetical protein